MIADKDRSGWFGASDVSFITGNWKTKSWERWWWQKLGIDNSHFENRYTTAGTYWEHRILESLQVPGMELDNQILLPDLLLRVNLDGNTATRIYECKTFKFREDWKPPKKYYQQVSVQLFASGIPSAEIVAYGLLEAEYRNFFLEVDKHRLKEFDARIDDKWLSREFLPKLKILGKCLREGAWPDV